MVTYLILKPIKSVPSPPLFHLQKTVKVRPELKKRYCAVINLDIFLGNKKHISPFYYAQFSLINSKIKVVTLINLVSILRQKQWRGALYLLRY